MFFAVFITLTFANPILDFTPPTLTDNSFTNDDYAIINSTIDEQNLNQFDLDFDYTQMDDYLVGYWRFDNIADLIRA